MLLHSKQTMKTPVPSLYLIKIFYVFLLSFSTITNAHSDLETLLKLKSSMLTPKVSGLHDWSVNSSPSQHCTFSGVTCDTTSRVIALTISNVPLFGTLPPEIGMLENLINLTLVSVNLTGQLPSEMSKLTSLKYVNLSANSLTGVFRGEIFGTMMELEVFDVFNNNFTGFLPTEFVKLKKLKILRLGGSYFSGEIPASYSEFESLESLGLQGNGLTGKIPASLAKLQKLQELRLGYFNTYEGGIPAELGSVSSLRLIDLGGCNLTGKIPTSLGNLKNLHSLFLQMNHLIGHIPAELSGLVSINLLDLSLNSLTGEIPGSFAELKNLTLINLFVNKLQGQLPEFIGQLPMLEVLQIWDNNFTFHLPENLGQNGRLYILDVANNHLTGRIPKDLCKSGRLKRLVLMQNYFFGPIPEELGDCKSLKRVRLMKNSLNGTIPEGFFNLPLSDILELNDNYFTGELPMEISGESLVSLTLSNNRVTGEIPSGIGNLVQLETLSLDMNRFIGEIPREISNLNKVLTLNFSGNDLTGEIPASIARCKRLTSVDLSQNELNGEIPKEISELESLTKLNLSRNRLSGEIADKIGNLTRLTVLDLSYNNFSGIRPTNGLLEFIPDNFFAGNPNLCTPWCHSASKRNKTHEATWVVITVIIVVTVPLLMVITWISIRRRKLENSRTWKFIAIQKLNLNVEDVLECLKEENIIGKGGFGIVYRGSMANGVDVAIKRLVGRGSGRSDHGFSAEIQTLGRIRHRYIVRLLGYVLNKDMNLLLYEYMSNGSLGEILHGSEGAQLQWDTRYRIAVEAAKGLCYLHHDCSPSIIHRDFKSNNILLDSDYEAHVADFGLAKFFQDAGVSECMSSIAGSFGYIAPEYARTLKVSQKSDVYSFGVVLLELITGRKPVGGFGEGVNIVGWVREIMSELSQPSYADSVLAVVDSRLTGYPLTGVINLFKIAMLCVKDESAARPTMREVVHLLTRHQSSPESS